MMAGVTTMMNSVLPGQPLSPIAPAPGKCLRCHGTGWRISKDAQAREVAMPCGCRKPSAAAQTDRLVQAAQIPPRFADKTFANYAAKHPSQADAQDALRRIVKLYPQTRGVLLQGTPGVGKTHLAVAALRELMDKKRIPCLFADFVALLHSMKASWKSGAEDSESEILQPVREMAVVLLDDIGSQIAPWALDTLTYLINERYNHGRVTLLTTNWLDEPTAGDQSLEQRIGSRLRSRLHEMCVTLQIAGADFRRK